MARLADIVAIASDMSGIPASALIGPQGLKHISRVRQACFLIAREHGKDGAAIARYFKRDRATVTYGIGKALEIADAEPRYEIFLECLRERCASELPFVRERALPVVTLQIERPRQASAPEDLPSLPHRPVKPKNDFRAADGGDTSHREAEAVALGTQALLAALLAAQSQHRKAA